jgi:tetratricopeptide (TPR) repeat protein
MSGRIEKTVFISYRRANKPWALFIYQNLTHNGFDVFIDFQNINSGNFETAILDNIKSRAHFIIVLTPSALERCKEPSDWLRKEIETALDEKRNIIPLMVEGFDFGSELVKNALTGKLSVLSSINGLRIPDEYPFEAMDRLRERYLSVPLSNVALPVLPKEIQEVTLSEKSAADQAPPVTKEQLTAQKWFEQGFVFYENKDYENAIHSYTEAIKLIPGFAGAYNNRGNIYTLINNIKKAINDYSQAIDLDSNYAMAYCNRGLAWIDIKEWDKAIYDLDKAIKLDSQYANAYINRGMAYFRKQNLDKALRDYNKALKIDSSSASAYNKRGVVKEKKGNFKGALKDFSLAIKYKYSEEEYLPYNNRGRIRQNMGDIENALSDYNQSILLNPSFSINYFNRGLVLEIKKEYLLAIADFQKYLELGGGTENKNQEETKEKIRDLKRKL